MNETTMNQPQEKIDAFYTYGQAQALNILGLDKHAGWWDRLWGSGTAHAATKPTTQTTGTTSYGTRPPGAPAPGQTPQPAPANKPHRFLTGGLTNQRNTLRGERVFGM